MLGACSSGSDQAQPERDAAPSSNATEAPQMQPIAKPPSFSPNFNDVELTHVAPSNCTTKESDDKTQMLVTCSDVGVNLVGDQVWVKVPDYHYRVNVRIAPAQGYRNLETTQRDWANIKVHSSFDDDVTYNTPYKDATAQRKTPWIVGIDNHATSGDTKIHITISYLKM